jgi:hypothetical protein
MTYFLLEEEPNEEISSDSEDDKAVPENNSNTSK